MDEKKKPEQPKPEKKHQPHDADVLYRRPVSVAIALILISYVAQARADKSA